MKTSFYTFSRETFYIKVETQVDSKHSSNQIRWHAKAIWFLAHQSTKTDYYTMDLSEFNVNVMTRNNGAYQRSPYDPVIQKWPFFFVQTQEFFSLQWNGHLQAISWAP